MPRYLLFYARADVTSDDLVIAEAPSHVDAIRTYGLQVGIRDTYFTEYAYSSVFAERFYVGLQHERTGNWVLSQDHIRARVRERVTDYFRGREDFTARFMDYANKKSPHCGQAFPDEMLLHIWLQEYAGDLEVIDLDTISRIVYSE